MEAIISISSPHVPILAARGYRLRALVFGEMELAYRYISSGNRKKKVGKDKTKVSRRRLNFFRDLRRKAEVRRGEKRRGEERREVCKFTRPLDVANNTPCGIVHEFNAHLGYAASRSYRDREREKFSAD